MNNIRNLGVMMAFLCATFAATAQSRNARPLPDIVKRADGKGYHFMVDGKPFIMLGAQMWNSSGWPHIIEKTWPQLRELNCNVLEVPVYWQHIEPEQGKFDFRALDSLIAGARREKVRLILLWFASYKNGNSQYPPEWVLNRPDLYPRVKDASGAELLTLSPVSQANIDADKKAFVEMMRHIKKVDEREQTVIMMQVENESGTLGTDRDYSEAATALFNGQVPSSLIQKLGKQPGTWKELFGVNAPETFNAYYISSYINQVAEAGKKEYGLPMYANAWQKENRWRRPGGDYPSGGPTSNMIHIWKAAAPSLSLLAADIYLGNVVDVEDLCIKYNRPDNPLFIPETGKGPDYARYHFHMLGNFNSLGVAVYGIDPYHGDPHDERRKDRLDDKFSGIAANYRLLRGALDTIAAYQNTGRMKSAMEDHGRPEQVVNFDGYDVFFNYGLPTYKKDRTMTGRALVLQLGADEFLVMGFDARFQFRPSYGSDAQSAEIIVMEEGAYENGKWVRKRIWNGDEVYHSTLLPEGVILKIKLRPVGKAFGGKSKANFE